MSFDAEQFLNKPYYAADFSDLISGVLDFLNFSERNIDWQFRSARSSLQRQKEIRSMPEEYYDNMQESIDQRFTVSLPMQIRYGALISLVTAIDWSAEFLAKKKRIDLEIPEKPRKMNLGVHTLNFFHTKTSPTANQVLKRYENLVRIRNAIVHGAGVVRENERRRIEQAVNSLSGFYIKDISWLGDAITIRRGALEPYIEEMAVFIPELYRSADEKGLLA